MTGFRRASINGITPQSEYKTRLSQNAIVVNKTTAIQGEPVTIRALCNAPIVKQEPVTFYQNGTAIGTSTFVGVTATLITTELSTGTIHISATWPGEGRYAGFTDIQAPPITVFYGYQVPTPFVLSANPASGAGIVGDAITFNLSNSTSTNFSGTNVSLYIDNALVKNFQLGNGNFGYTTSTFSSTGTYSITARWNGGFVDGKYWRGTSSNTLSYNVKYIHFPAALTLTTDPNPNSINSTTTLTATFSTSTTATGTVSFKRNGTVIGTSTLTNNVAVLAKTSSTFVAGTSTIVAQWSGSGIYTATISNSVVQTMLTPTTSSVTLTLSTDVFQKYNPDGSLNTSYPYAIVNVYGYNNAHQTTGGLKLIHGSNYSTLGTQTINNSGTYYISINPTAFSSLGSLSMNVAYSGDYWNYAKTTDNKSILVKKNVPVLTMSGPGIVYPDTPLVFSCVKESAAVLTEPVTFYDSLNNVLGTANFDGNYATITLTRNASNGDYAIKASYPGDDTHEAVVTEYLPYNQQPYPIYFRSITGDNYTQISQTSGTKYFQGYTTFNTNYSRPIVGNIKVYLTGYNSSGQQIVPGTLHATIPVNIPNPVVTNGDLLADDPGKNSVLLIFQITVPKYYSGMPISASHNMYYWKFESTDGNYEDRNSLPAWWGHTALDFGAKN